VTHIEAAAPARPNILIVDDNPSNLRLLASMLKDHGYKPRPVLSGELALEAARLSPPDLILLDVTMPEMDGFSVCERLRADPSLSAIPVLFISALTDTASKVNAFTAGGCDYITKPFQFEEVEARVKTQLQLQSQKRELQRNYEELKRLEALRDSLAHMVVHDMRGQLMAMMLSLDLLPSSDSDESVPHLDRVRTGITTLVEMTTLMLDVNRLEAEEMPLNKTECKLSAISMTVIDSLSSMAGKRRVSLLADNAITAKCDSELIRRVLQNLLANALKFTAPDGSIEVKITELNDIVRVSVHDNGTGIPFEHQSRIFDKFHQAAPSKISPSTGLGLAFSRLAVEAHGGQIGVESEFGVGSTFWFTLPNAGVSTTT
jgi:signal transduction histidine kinase